VQSDAQTVYDIRNNPDTESGNNSFNGLDVAMWLYGIFLNAKVILAGCHS